MIEPLIEIHAAAYRQLGQLNVTAFLGRAADYSRGGLPGQSMSDGRGGGHGLGGFDRVDRLIRQKTKVYDSDIREILKLVLHAQLAESWMLEVAQAVPDEEVFMCANLPCEKPLEQGLKSGECQRCRVHLHRYGLHWPAKGSQVTGLRQSAVEEMVKDG